MRLRPLPIPLTRRRTESSPLPDALRPAPCTSTLPLGVAAPLLCSSVPPLGTCTPALQPLAHLSCSTSPLTRSPWMFCSARDAAGAPVAKGVRMTSFVAVKDDLLNAGAEWVDEPVVNCRNMITSRTPDDLTPFCLAIIDAVAAAGS